MFKWNSISNQIREERDGEPLEDGPLGQPLQHRVDGGLDGEFAQEDDVVMHDGGMVREASEVFDFAHALG